MLKYELAEPTLQVQAGCEQFLTGAGSEAHGVDKKATAEALGASIRLLSKFPPSALYKRRFNGPSFLKSSKQVGLLEVKKSSAAGIEWS